MQVREEFAEDDRVDRVAERVTRTGGRDQLLYFTTSSLDREDTRLWFVSDHSGHPNLHVLDLRTGAHRQLTDNRHGRLWQYQGFDGDRGRGLAVWSVALDDRIGRLYHIQNDAIRAVDPDGATRALARVPAGQTTAFIAVSDCGRWLCVPTTDERALVEPTREGCAPGGAAAIDRRCQDEGLNSYLRVYDTENGALAACVAVPRCWITHVQFRPGRPEQILYNHEWPDRSGARRMWLWDGQRHRCLRPADADHSAEDWICHEVLSADGRHIVYHGRRANGPALVGRCEVETGILREVLLPPGWNRYGHFQVGPAGTDRLVCDGYYEQPGDAPDAAAEWLTLQAVDWAAGTLAWSPLCRHRSSWRTQDDHPHPIFDHAGRHVYFTGGTGDGGRAVHRVALPD